MSEDRLERALEALRQEAVDDSTVEAARARVRNQMTSVAGSGSSCTEFRPDFDAYLSGAIVGSRRVLMDDHLSRCAACRTALAELKGERPAVAMPRSSSTRWARWASLAAAAAVVFGLLYAGRDAIDRMMAPAGPRATVVSVTGGLYRLAGGPLAENATIDEGEVVRTGAGARAVLRLADGSVIDVNERTELFTTAAWSGMAVHLQRGDVIVQAARQRRGQLRVLTRDSIASVKGTVFAVSAGLGGSVVSVVEGSVAVRQPGTDVVLSPGEQAASNPALTSTIAQAVSWSPNAEEYLELLATFGMIEQQVAESLPSQPRTTSALLPYLPPQTFAYGAIPNLGGRIGLALALADEQSSENAVFGVWWTSDEGMSLRQMIARLQSVSGLLEEEVVFSASTAAPDREIPMVIARVRPGRSADLARALDGMFAGTDEPPLSYSVSGDLMVVSSSADDLSWALANMGQGATSPFATAIGERYQRGAAWLLAIDAPALVTVAAEDDAPPVELAAMIGVKYVFLEQRAPAGIEENEVTLLFDGERTGMASWLADTGSGGAAEYLSADALVAGYVSMQQPWQLFEDLTALMTQQDDDFAGLPAELEQTLGPGFIANLATAMGGEAALSVNGLSLSGPTWTMAALAYNPAVVDSSIQALMDAFNAQLALDGEDQRIVLSQETVGGRDWNTLTAGALPFGLTWTYDRGYMVAASDRGTAERAIAVRNGGSPLVWSTEFRNRLPTSAALHPSAFAWVNTARALDIVSALAPDEAAAGLLATREPVLVVFDVASDRIHAASRTRLFNVILPVMALQSLGQTSEGLQTTAEPQ